VQLASVRSNPSSCAVFFFLGLDLGEDFGLSPVECAATSTSAKPASSSSSSIFGFLIPFDHGIPESSQESIGFVEELLTF